MSFQKKEKKKQIIITNELKRFKMREKIKYFGGFKIKQLTFKRVYNCIIKNQIVLQIKYYVFVNLVF